MYFGKRVEKPYIGDDVNRPVVKNIYDTVKMMICSYIFSLCFFLFLNGVLELLWGEDFEDSGCSDWLGRQLFNRLKLLLNILDRPVDDGLRYTLFSGDGIRLSCRFKKDNLELLYWQEEIRRFVLGKSICVLYGTAEYDDNHIYNAQKVLLGKGYMGSYKKIYLGNEEKKIFSAGASVEIFITDKGVPFSIALCYDMHFPEIAMYAAIKGALLLFAPHLMPGFIAAERINTWQKYLGARAYDNRLGVLAVNAIVNGKGGGAAFWNPEGDMLSSLSRQADNLFIVDVDLENLNSYRDNIKYKNSGKYFLQDRIIIGEEK